MIDRDRVLPRISGERLDALAVELQYSSSTMIPGRGGYEARLTEISVEAQRDADWEKMQILVKAVREALEEAPWVTVGEIRVRLRTALAQMGLEMRL